MHQNLGNLFIFSLFYSVFLFFDILFRMDDTKSPACWRYEDELSVLFPSIFGSSGFWLCDRFSDMETFSSVGNFVRSIRLLFMRFSSCREAALSLSNLEFKDECSEGELDSKLIDWIEDLFLSFSWFFLGVLLLLGCCNREFSDKNVRSGSCRLSSLGCTKF